MGQHNLIEEINALVLKAITPGMTVEQRQAVREKITNDVLEERAKIAQLCPDEVKKMWGEAKNLGHSFTDLAHKLGL